MASSRDKQQIEFWGICLNGPFKNQEIEGKINLDFADSIRLTQKSSYNYRENNSDYNRRFSKQNYRDRDDYREERSGYYDASSRYRDRDEDSGDRMQLLIVLFGLIFFVNLVTGQLITPSNSSSSEKVTPAYQYNADY